MWAGLVADAGIQFRLAKITRTQTSRTDFGLDDTVKSRPRVGVPTPAQPRPQYLGVPPLGGGLLGYAQFPGGPAATDGVVVLHSAFGTTGTATAPFDLGRTVTHEVGHYLDLRHIWGETARIAAAATTSRTRRSGGQTTTHRPSRALLGRTARTATCS